MARVQGFIYDCQTQITETLKIADAWSALKAEWDAMVANGKLPTQADVDAVFGTGVLTLAEFNAALSAQQALVDSVHAPATRNPLYRVKR